jgi:hypothetical protein
MQTSDSAGKFQHGFRPLHGDMAVALAAQRAAPGDQTERQDADGRRRPAARMPSSPPRRYGAGF